MLSSRPLLPIFRLLPSREMPFIPIRGLGPAPQGPSSRFPFSFSRSAPPDRPPPRSDTNQLPS